MSIGISFQYFGRILEHKTEEKNSFLENGSKFTTKNKHDFFLKK